MQKFEFLCTLNWLLFNSRSDFLPRRSSPEFHPPPFISGCPQRERTRENHHTTFPGPQEIARLANNTCLRFYFLIQVRNCNCIAQRKEFCPHSEQHLPFQIHRKTIITQMMGKKKRQNDSNQNVKFYAIDLCPQIPTVNTLCKRSQLQ